MVAGTAGDTTEDFWLPGEDCVALVGAEFADEATSHAELKENKEEKNIILRVQQNLKLNFLFLAIILASKLKYEIPKFRCFSKLLTLFSEFFLKKPKLCRVFDF